MNEECMKFGLQTTIATHFSCPTPESESLSASFNMVPVASVAGEKGLAVPVLIRRKAKKAPGRAIELAKGRYRDSTEATSPDTPPKSDEPSANSWLLGPCYVEQRAGCSVTVAPGTVGRNSMYAEGKRRGRKQSFQKRKAGREMYDDLDDGRFG